MDRYEYKEIIDGAREKIGQGLPDEAGAILDGVNWRKVHNVNALVKAAGLYEETGRLEDAKDLLLAAHERSPIGRMVIYHLALICIKLGEYDEAQEFYEEFIEIAPHDNLQYVIRYRLGKASGADDAALIAILEELKDQDFLEDWAYELALLYEKTGQIRKCVELCDEIILWFGDGPFVKKSLELKMKYSPLDPEQENKYRLLLRQNPDEVSEVSLDAADPLVNIDAQAAEPAREDIPSVEIASPGFNTVNLQAEIRKNIQEIMQATEPGQLSESIKNLRSLTDRLPLAQAQGDTREMQARRQKQDQDRIDENLKNQFQAYLQEENDGQISMVVPDQPVREEQIKGQMSIGDIVNDWEKTKRAAQAALEDADKQKLESAKAQALAQANQIMDQLTGALPRLDQADAAREDVEKEKYLSDASMHLHEVAGAAAAGTAEDEDYRKATRIMAGVNDILQKEIDRLQNETEGSAPQTEAEAAPAESEEEPSEAAPAESEEEPAEVTPTGADEQPAEVETAQTGIEEQPAELEEAAGTEAAETEEPEEEKPGEACIVLPEGLSALVTRDEDKEAQASDLEEEEPDVLNQAEAAMTQADSTSEQPKAASEEVEPDSEEIEEASEQQEEVSQQAQEALEQAQEAPQEAQAASEQSEETAGQPEAVQEQAEKAQEQAGVEQEQPKEASEQSKEAPRQEEEAASEQEDAAEQPKPAEESLNAQEPEPDHRDAIEEAFRLQATRATWSTHNMEMNPIEAMSPENVFKQDAYAIREAADTEDIPPLTEDEKKRFAYFIPIDGMDTQISRALVGLRESLKGQTGQGHKGHLIICGSMGSGKTMMATEVIQTLQHEIHRPRGSAGKINGGRLNDKNVIMLFDRIKGGALIVENASQMSRVTVATLNALMDSDDRGTLVILEDDPKGIKEVLGLNRQFADKFTNTIDVPIFTIDELVNFGRSYAKEQDCVVEEMAILAMYNRINNIQRPDHPTSLQEVRDVVDQAISSAKEGGIRKAFSRLATKKFDKDGRLILHEKDFEV